MKILIPLAEGFEEIEATTVVDVLRRAGMEVVSAGIPGTMIRGSRGMYFKTDKKLDEIEPNEFDMLVLVGGDPGYKNLGRSQSVLKAIADFNSQNKKIAAICAAPTILAKMGILDEKRATVYPGFEKQIPRPRGDRVFVDENIITAQGPGTAMEFALKIVEILLGPESARTLKRELVY